MRSINAVSEYQKRYESLTQRFDTAKTQMEAVTGEIQQKDIRRATIEAFLTDLLKQDVRFTFKGGTEFTA